MSLRVNRKSTHYGTRAFCYVYINSSAVMAVFLLKKEQEDANRTKRS